MPAQRCVCYDENGVYRDVQQARATGAKYCGIHWQVKGKAVQKVKEFVTWLRRIHFVQEKKK